MRKLKPRNDFIDTKDKKFRRTIDSVNELARVFFEIYKLWLESGYAVRTMDITYLSQCTIRRNNEGDVILMEDLLQEWY